MKGPSPQRPGEKADSCRDTRISATERKWVTYGESPVSGVEQPFDIVKMSICLQLINNFNGMTTKSPARLILGTQAMCVFGKIKVHEQPGNVLKGRWERRVPDHGEGPGRQQQTQSRPDREERGGNQSRRDGGRRGSEVITTLV